MKLLEDILNTCKPSTLLCIAADITLQTEFIKTKSITDWKKKIPQIDKRPCIFIIHSGL
jgi:16S rRNA (cytidine1402-2'-O)-methyltransferase